MYPNLKNLTTDQLERMVEVRDHYYELMEQLLERSRPVFLKHIPGLKIMPFEPTRQKEADTPEQPPEDPFRNAQCTTLQTKQK